MKKMIGVVPKGELWDMQKSNMSDVYSIGNNYCKRVQEIGALPVAVTPVDGRLTKEALALYDGYVVQGGSTFYPYHYQIIHDAVENGKRYLGICLGEQMIQSYFMIRKAVEERGYEGDLLEAILAFRKEHGSRFPTLQKVEGHRSEMTERGKEDEAKHDVNVVPGTILHRLLGRETVRAASYHNMNVPADKTVLTVNAWSAKGDNVVEGVELAPNILGVQFHPEVDDLLPEVFTFLVEE